MLKKLLEARIDAFRKGDIVKLWAIEDMLFYARLDPDDPDREEKVLSHKKAMHQQKVLWQAQKTIDVTGKPLNFNDKFIAISEAIDAAVERFEETPCPKHAADLLGLEECRSLLTCPITMEEPDQPEPDLSEPVT